MEGIVPWHRIRLSMTTEGGEQYVTEVSPPRSLRTLSFGQDGYFNYHVEGRIVHPESRMAEERIAEIENLAVGDAINQMEPLLSRARELVVEGRPWAALDLLDSSMPMFEHIRDQQNSIDWRPIIAVISLFIGLVFGAIACWAVLVLLLRYGKPE